MAQGQCPPYECVPDVIGICKFCGHEVVTPVDDDGNPVECTGDHNCTATHHYEGCFAYDQCFCTEEAIVQGCSVHDIQKFEPQA